LQAKDAAENMEASTSSRLPAAAQRARRPGRDAAQLYDDVPGNVGLRLSLRRRWKVAEAFRAAVHVTKFESEKYPRGRGRDGAARGALQVRRGSGALHAQRAEPVFAMKGTARRDARVAPEKVRMLCWNRGGSFGMKASIYPEYLCIAHARGRSGGR